MRDDCMPTKSSSGCSLDEPSFEKELEALINRHSLENLSNTPDFMLAKYLGRCLENYQETVRERDQWHRQ